MNVQRFGFDRVFRFPAAAEESQEDFGPLQDRIAALEAEAVRAQAHFEAELAQARRDGFTAGLAQARHEREAAVLAATDALHAAFDDVEERVAAAETVMMRDMATLAFTAAEVLAGHAVDRAPARAVDEALTRLLAQVSRGTPLSIRVNPDIVGEMEELVRMRQAGDRRRLDLSVVPDATLAPGDGVIFWEEGGMSVEAATRREAVVAELGPLLAPGIAHDPEKDLRI